MIPASMNRPGLLFWAWLLPGLLAACQPSPSLDASPNIIVILADDMGYSDLGCTGAEIPTPHLDRLAREGHLMTEFYNAARCCPSRAALMAGVYPHQAGMGDMVEGRLWHDSTFLSAYQGWLNTEIPTLAEALKDHGYQTLLSGKWHLGNDEPYWPDNRGFERTFAMLHGAGNYFNLKPWISEDQFMRLHLDKVPYEPGENFYMTTAITDHALAFMEERDASKPFFLYLSYTAPHWPLHALPEDIDRFRGSYLEGWHELRRRRFERMKELGILDPTAELSPAYERSPELTPHWDTLSAAAKETWDLRMAVYAAQVYRMDQDIGRVLQHLEDQQELDNTLILFLSDNGATHSSIYRATSWVVDRSGPIGSAASFDAYGGRWGNMSNVPFRLFKHWTTEGGIKTPLIIHWPDGLAGTAPLPAYGHIIDLMPTCLRAAGLSAEVLLTTYPHLEGINLFEGPSSAQDERMLFWEHQDHWAVRQGPWKLVYTHEQGSHPAPRLFHLQDDPAELHDLKEQHPGRYKRLHAAYQQWAKEVGVLPFDSLILARDL